MATTAHALTHVGFTPRQALQLKAGSLTLDKLIAVGFPRYQARAILKGGKTRTSLISEGKLTAAQADLILAV